MSGSGLDGILAIAPGEALESVRQLRARSDLEAQALRTLLGAPGAETTSDGIAVVRVVGSLYRGLFFDDYADIQGEVDAALADASVRAIVLEIDSPGGLFAGCLDLARHICALRDVKPIWAIVNDQATSAAYAIASAAERVYSVRTGITGSLGVVAGHVDVSQMNAQLGVTITEISSGARKLDWSSNSPLREQGRASLQRVVDVAADELFDVVAHHRALRVAAIRAQEAQLYVGADGLRAGLIDDVGTIHDALADLRAFLSGAVAA